MLQVRYLARRLARVICLGITVGCSQEQRDGDLTSWMVFPVETSGIPFGKWWFYGKIIGKPREMGVLWENDRKTIGKWWFYPQVNFHITDGKISIFNGQIHYFDWAIFNSYVKLTEDEVLKTKSGLLTSIDHSTSACADRMHHLVELPRERDKHNSSIPRRDSWTENNVWYTL